MIVVVGARADDVRAVLPADMAAVEAADWRDGMGASLRAGLAALENTDATAAVVHLVDLPGVSAAVVSRLSAAAERDVLARAAYGGRPGHPVLLGRAHWPGVRDAAVGDAGARGSSPGARTSCWWSAPTWLTRTTSTPRSSWPRSAAVPLRGRPPEVRAHVRNLRC